MKNPKGILLLNLLLLVLFLSVIFYLLGFFLTFKVGDFSGTTIVLLMILFVLSSFCLGVFVISINPLPPRKNLLQILSFAVIILSIPILIIYIGTPVFKIVAIAVLPILVFHVVILGVSLMSFIKERKKLYDNAVIMADRDDKRRCKRIRNYAAAQYLSAGGKWQEAGVYDTSASGIRLITKSEFSCEDIIELKIYIPQESRPIFVKGKVVWVKEVVVQGKTTFHIGINFTEIDPSDSLRLSLKPAYDMF